MRSDNMAKKIALNAVRLPKFEPVNGKSWSPAFGSLVGSSLKLAARCPVSGCWPSCYTQEQRGRIQVLLVGGAHGSELETFDLRRWEHYYDVRGRAAAENLVCEGARGRDSQTESERNIK